MKTVILGTLCTAILTLAGATLADNENPTQQPRLGLDLTDGSYLIGTADIESLPVRTAYATLSIPLKQISTVKIDDNRETASVALQNGDKLKGVVDLKSFNLETVIGKVTIGTSQVIGFRVTSSGGLQGALSTGLVLHYSFDDEEGEKVTDQSVTGANGYWVGTPRYEEGIKGKAARFTSKDTYIVSPSPRLNMNGWKEVTVSLWVSVSQYTTYGQVMSRGAVSTDQHGTFEFAVGSTYGKGLIHFNGRTPQAATELKTSKENLSLNQWHHLVMTYDRTTIRYYIDEQLVGSTPPNQMNTPIWDAPDTKLVIGTISRLPFINWGDMYFDGLVDEVYILDRALTENDVRQVYETQRPKK